MAYKPIFLITMKNVFAVILVLMWLWTPSQIGINTSSPLATLEVHISTLSSVPEGIIPPRITADSLQMKDHLYGPAQNGAMIYITTPVSKTSSRTQQVTSSGYYVYDAGYSNKDRSKGTWKKMFSDPNAFAASSISPVTFASKALDSSTFNFYVIKFDSAIENEIGSEYITDHQYTVPDTGLYVINYFLAFETNEKTVAQRPSVAIVKSNFNTSKAQILSSKLVDGILTKNSKSDRIALSPQAGINHIYNLVQGEQLSFGLITENESLSSYGSVSTEISIYKIR